MKNHYRLIAVDLTRRKELDADPKATEQIEIVGQLKKKFLLKLKLKFPKENFLKEVYQY